MGSNPTQVIDVYMHFCPSSHPFCVPSLRVLLWASPLFRKQCLWLKNFGNWFLGQWN